MLGGKLLISVCVGISRINCRSFHMRSPYIRQYLRDLWNRQQLLGRDKFTPRSASVNWNHDAEIYAFGQRIGENISDETLRRIFTHRSVAEEERLSSKTSLRTGHTALSAQNFVVDVGEANSNVRLIENGQILISAYVLAYLRCHMPAFPEEGIKAVHDWLTSRDQLAYIGTNIGVVDLLNGTLLPPTPADIADTFKAVVGGIEEDCGAQRAEAFVQDLVLTQLLDLDVNEMWQVVNPMGVLIAFLQNQKRGAPEPRLLRRTGDNTVMPVYIVGIYSDKELIGESPGESVLIAEEMAARDALRNLFGTRESHLIFAFGKEGHKVNVDAFRDRKNWSISAIVSQGWLERKNAVEPEPMTAEHMLMKYKERVEKPLGIPYRRRLKHRFYPGTRYRKYWKGKEQPSVERI